MDNYEEITSRYPDDRYPKSEKKKIFLRHYKAGLSIKSAAAAAEVKSHVTIYEWLKKDPKFNADFEKIKQTVRKKVLKYVYEVIELEHNPVLLKRLLDSKLFSDTEYRAVKPIEYNDTDDLEEDNDVTLEI